MSSVNKPEPGSETPGTVSEDLVATYLRAHPDFFDRHQNLLTSLRIPHRPGGAVSLVEKQVASLRQKNLQLERKLRDLVDVARSNDELAIKVHGLATRLLAAGNRAHAVSVAEELLRSSFNAEQSVLVLFETDAAGEFASHGEFGRNETRFLRLIDRADPALGPFKTFLLSGEPRCGKIRDSQKIFLFGPDTDEIGSAALVPLGENAATGMLAIGSRDADYFHPGQSMDFLARLGDLLGCALALR
jgi:uncharacterized protein YigA (DUF484 family)